MKKRGFTLVEMLAVLVLVIALSLIVFPSIINYINSSKGDISNVTKEMVLSNAKLYVSDNKSMFSEFLNNTYCLTIGDLIDRNYLDADFKDSVSGEAIDRNKKIKVQYAYDDDMKTNVFKYDLDDNCAPVSMICAAKTRATNGNLATGEYNYGDEYICDVGDGIAKTFYVLENGDTTTLTDGRIAQAGEVSLIMDMNIDSNGKGTTEGNMVAWCEDETLCKTNGNWDYTKGPITANNYLSTSTTSWTKLSSNQVSLPSAYQMAKASGKTYTGNVFSGLSTWLYGNLSSSSINGYWSSTPYVSMGGAHMVVYNGFFGSAGITNNTGYGIRPVITIQKAKISN